MKDIKKSNISLNAGFLFFNFISFLLALNLLFLIFITFVRNRHVRRACGNNAYQANTGEFL